MHHRGRGAHVASRRRRATRARPSRSRCGSTSPALAERDAGEVRRCSTQLDSIQIVYCQTWQYDDAVARLARPARRRPAPSPLLRHRRHDHATARQQHRREAMLRGELDLALITSAEALATQAAAQEAGRALRRTRSRPPRRVAVPVGVAARSDRGRARGVPGLAHVRGVRQRPPGAPRRRRSTTYRARDRRDARADDRRSRRANPHAWFRVARTAAEIIDARARQPHGRLPVHEVHGRR